MPVAVLDFGTNTFNLLIAEKQAGSFRVLYVGKEGVKLGKGGINRKTIAPDAIERGLFAISKHMEHIREYGVEEIHAYATSAIRNAENGNYFTSLIRERFGFETNIISGEHEAELIYKGIRISLDMHEESSLILDIGGGSNEFILCNNKGILWKHSFEIGMARIIEMFPISDPIRNDEIIAIENYFREELDPLIKEAERYRPTRLIGASGSFNTLAAMTQHRWGLNINDNTSMEISMDQYTELYELILRSTVQERLAIPGMEPVRVEMIVPATIFITFVLKNCGLNKMIQSAYALKEGVMAELTNC